MANFTYVVTEEDVRLGLSIKALVREKSQFSSRLLSRLKRDRLIFCNGQDVPLWQTPSAGDMITVIFPDESSDFPPEDIPVEAVYEDDDILVINKQPGFVVHPTKGKPCHTMANGIMYRMLELGQSYKIRFVNRLDMNTSGLLIVAKNSHSQDSLTKQMKSGEVSKTYVALACGVFEHKVGTVSAPVGRPDENQVERWILPVDRGGYPSVTHYKVLEQFREHALVELRLETGRTHQIRVHLSYIGHPILGDHLYCHGDPFKYRKEHGDVRFEQVSDLIPRQALHASKLTFIHPTGNEVMEFEAPLPGDMRDALAALKCL